LDVAIRTEFPFHLLAENHRSEGYQTPSIQVNAAGRDQAGQAVDGKETGREA
jgi:hypothetical protein